MSNLIKSEKGVTLVEVIMAVALLVILFVMFGGIFASTYRTNIFLNENKSGREHQVAIVESTIGSAGTLQDTGKVDVVLDFSSAGIETENYPIIDGSGKIKVEDARIYRSGEYGTPTAKNKYIYAYGK